MKSSLSVGIFSLKMKVLVTLIILVPHMTVYILSYPGFLQADHQSLIANIAVGEPSQWHSLLWGYLAFPFLYLSPSYGLYGLVQTFVLVVCAVYSLYKLSKLNLLGKRGILLVATIFGISPTLLLYNTLYASDIIFAYMLMPLCISFMEIALSNGKIFNNKFFCIRFCVLLFVIYELRKNAIIILVFSFFLLFIIFIDNRKRVLSLFLVLCVGVVGANSFWTYGLNATPSPSQEMLSVPSVQIGYVFAHNGEIPSDAKAYLLSIRSEQEWKDRYSSFSADGEKDGLEFTFDFVKAWFEIGIRNPLAYVRAYIDLMHPYWEITSSSAGLNIGVDFYNHEKFTSSICDVNDCKSDYVNQISREWSPVMLWISGVQGIILNTHWIGISDLLRLVFFNRALPFWIFVCGLLISLKKNKLKEYLVISLPLWSVLVSLLFFSPIASFRYIFQVFCILPIVGVYLKRMLSLSLRCNEQVELRKD